MSEPGSRGEYPKDRLAEMRESELWNKEVPGIKGWTMGGLVEELIACGEFDPNTETMEDLYRMMEEKLKKDAEK